MKIEGILEVWIPHPRFWASEFHLKYFNFHSYYLEVDNTVFILSDSLLT